MIDADTYLSANEIRSLTGKRWHSTQRVELRNLGIDSLVRTDGTLVVRRDAVDAVLPPPASARPARPAAPPAPDFDALDGLLVRRAS